MPITGTTVLREMSFWLKDGSGYDALAEDVRRMNLIVAKGSLKVTSMKWDGNKNLIESRYIQKAFITGHDVAKAFVECEKVLREATGADPDHCFFEGVDRIINDGKNQAEVICWRWGS